MAPERVPEDDQENSSDNENGAREPSLLYWVVSFTIIVILLITLIYA